MSGFCGTDGPCLASDAVNAGRSRRRSCGWIASTPARLATFTAHDAAIDSGSSAWQRCAQRQVRCGRERGPQLGRPQPRQPAAAYDNACNRLGPGDAAVEPVTGQGEHQVPPGTFEIQRELPSAVGDEDVSGLQGDRVAISRESHVAVEDDAGSVEVSARTAYVSAGVRCADARSGTTAMPASPSRRASISPRRQLPPTCSM